MSYGPSTSNIITFTIQAPVIPTHIASFIYLGISGNLARFQGILLDNNNNPIGGKTVALMISPNSDGSGATVWSTVTTSANGVIGVNGDISSITPGTYYAYLSYDGN